VDPWSPPELPWHPHTRSGAAPQLAATTVGDPPFVCHLLGSSEKLCPGSPVCASPDLPPLPVRRIERCLPLRCPQLGPLLHTCSQLGPLLHTCSQLGPLLHVRV
jgi:hypothetical protein